MTKEQPAPAGADLRVSGAATLVAPCDAASFVVTLRASGATLGRANATLRRRIARFDKTLIAHASAVTSAQHQPILHQPTADQVTAEAHIRVTSPNNAALSDLLSDIHKVGDADIGPLTWSLSPDNPVYEFVRRAAAEDAVDSARTHARVVKANLLGLTWLANDEPPARLDDNDVNAVVRSEVLAQFSLGPADLG